MKEMRVIIILFMVIIVFGCGGGDGGGDNPSPDPAQNENVSGVWEGTATNVDGNNVQTTLNLTQDGSNIGGTCDTVDENGNTVSVPKLEPQTVDEKRRYNDAIKRREIRMASTHSK